MTGNVSKYALIGGKEVTLLESISHASSGEVVCVFEHGSGNRRFVSKEEWDAGAEEFARYAAEKHLVTSMSPGRDKIALFRSLFRGRDERRASTRGAPLYQRQANTRGAPLFYRRINGRISLPTANRQAR